MKFFALNWHLEYPEELSKVLMGQVIGARYSETTDTLELLYSDNRSVQVMLKQCEKHTCERTEMVVKTNEN